MHLVLGQSEDVDTPAALHEVLAKVRAGLKPAVGPPRAALLFATAGYDRHALVAGVGEAFTDLPLIGCTVDAISSSTLGYHEDALALVVFCGEDLRAATGVGRNLSQEPDGAVALVSNAVREAKQALGVEPLLCLSFCESLTVSGAKLVQGLVEGAGAGVPVIGGTATDDGRFERTYQFHGSEVLSDSATFLLLGGNLNAAWCAESGWYPVGVEGRVTEVEGKVLRRVGEESAIEFYQRYLGEGLLPSVDNPLAVSDSADSPGFYLRSPLSANEATGEVTFMGGIPLGATLRVTETCRDDILAASRRAGERAREHVESDPHSVLFFSCGSRKNQLGTRTPLELDMLRKATGNAGSVFGVYTNGEFGSLQPQGPSHFRNMSIIARLLSGQR